MRRFDASPRTATPKGHQSFISYTAPHQAALPTIELLSVLVAHGRQVPQALRCDPRRRRHPCRAHRRPDAPHERNHGTLGTDLPPRTAGPNTDLEPAPSAARPARVRAAPQLP